MQLVTAGGRASCVCVWSRPDCRRALPKAQGRAGPAGGNTIVSYKCSCVPSYQRVPCWQKAYGNYDRVSPDITAH